MQLQNPTLGDRVWATVCLLILELDGYAAITRARVLLFFSMSMLTVRRCAKNKAYIIIISTNKF